MALKKQKRINRDITANYWNIESFRYGKSVEKLQVILALYTSKLSRNEGEKPIEFHTLHLTGVDMLEANILRAIYQRLKVDPAYPSPLSILVTEEIPEELDEDGEIIQEYVPAVYKSFFKDSEDD